MGGYLRDVSSFQGINTKSELRKLRTKLTEDIDNLNTILFDYYKNDRRLHMPILTAISILTNAVNTVDNALMKTL